MKRIKITKKIALITGSIVLTSGVALGVGLGVGLKSSNSPSLNSLFGQDFIDTWNTSKYYEEIYDGNIDNLITKEQPERIKSEEFGPWEKSFWTTGETQSNIETIRSGGRNLGFYVQWTSQPDLKSDWYLFGPRTHVVYVNVPEEKRLTDPNDTHLGINDVEKEVGKPLDTSNLPVVKGYEWDLLSLVYYNYDKIFADDILNSEFEIYDSDTLDTLPSGTKFVYSLSGKLKSDFISQKKDITFLGAGRIK